ncbi:hypothetical protein B296_00056207 [Ensete ventricosum]|uniref:AMP-activated protein kinase glycogen-binding domain-containing protein n=1 Tax=Ensete ventricosum TaxID=4639 RepID=A0A426XW61_ENSVE|nr:hypothetical protein B296_00056207 [Ensete ventricosum]
MSPVEGCPTVFQVIWSLTPGLHQYKFYVDGEWRHDERQPFATGNYGIVNTIYITREPNPPPALLSPGPPNSRMSMDVDHETFQHVVSVVTDFIMHVIVPKTSMLLNCHAP